MAVSASSAQAAVAFRRENIWLRRVDNSVGQLIVDDNRAYLLPLGNYADTPVKYLTANRALTIHSGLASPSRSTRPAASPWVSAPAWVRLWPVKMPRL